MSVWSRIVNVIKSDRLSSEIDEEIQSHIQEVIEQGRDPAEARRVFGNTLRKSEESRRKQSVIALILASLGPLIVPASASFGQSTPAKPLDPITAIVDAYKTHDVVALGEGDHNNEQGAAFRAKLYRDPRFQAVVNDIVVEWGNGRYQDMMDRYIAGENVPEKDLRKAWVETTQPYEGWDTNIPADMFHEIHDINLKLPKSKQLRVLLGDTPYTYDASNPRAPMKRTDNFPAGLILREVIARKRKALVVYGDMHYLRRPAQMPAEAKNPPQPGTIVMQLEKAGVKVLSVSTYAGALLSAPELTTLQPDIANWPKPSFAFIKDTPLGLAPFSDYYPKGAGMMNYRGPNGPVTIDLSEAIGGTVQDQYDAILYLGPRSEITFAKLSASLCADPDYVEMRVNRMSAMAAPPQAGRTPAGGPSAVDAFRVRCKQAVARGAMLSLARGEPDYSRMAPGLAEATRQQLPAIQKMLTDLGELRSVTFREVFLSGMDTFDIKFANGSLIYILTLDGKGNMTNAAIIRP